MNTRLACILFFFSVSLMAQQTEGLKPVSEADGKQEITDPHQTEIHQSHKVVQPLKPVTVEKKFLGTSADGERNMLLSFSNGLVFRYFNGEAKAYVEDEEVLIYGKYIIEMEKETVKFSYDPDTGVVWYTVNPNE